MFVKRLHTQRVLTAVYQTLASRVLPEPLNPRRCVYREGQVQHVQDLGFGMVWGLGPSLWD